MERVEQPKYPDLLRGRKLWRDRGELAYETRPWSTAPVEVTFLEWAEAQDTLQLNPWYARVINEHGRIEAVHEIFLHYKENK